MFVSYNFFPGINWVAIINAKFQIRQHRYQPNLTFDFGGYDYWRLWIPAGTALAVLKGVCGYHPYYFIVLQQICSKCRFFFI